MAIGYELEVTSLRKDCGFVVDGAVFETEEQAGGDPIATDDLEEVAHCKHATLFRTQCEKAVDSSLNMPNRYRLCWRSGLKGTDQHNVE
jgi:hypothetical protein